MYYPERVASYSSWAIPYESGAMQTYIEKRLEVAPPQRVDPKSPTEKAVVVHLRQHQEHAKARFRMLRRLGDNHDGEGARGANHRSVDSAIAFIDRHCFTLPLLATLDDDGQAVIEVHSPDRGIFADLTFRIDGSVECYYRKVGQPSEMYEGQAFSSATKAFISQFDVR